MDEDDRTEKSPSEPQSQKIELLWNPLSVRELQEVLSGLSIPWWVAGGWAIDLFVGRETRPHSDIDISIRRQDQTALQEFLSPWDLWVADPPGRLRPWVKGEFLGKGLQDVWCRPSPRDPWQFQVMLFDVEGEFWIFKRDESIRRSLKSMTIQASEGVQYWAPEVQLLYKAKQHRPILGSSDWPK